MTFREALLRISEDRHLSLKKIAEGAGVSYEQLKKLKQTPGGSTNVDAAQKIAVFLGMTINEMTGDHSAQDRAEIVEIYESLPPAERQFLLKSAKGLRVDQDQDNN